MLCLPGVSGHSLGQVEAGAHHPSHLHCAHGHCGGGGDLQAGRDDHVDERAAEHPAALCPSAHHALHQQPPPDGRIPEFSVRLSSCLPSPPHLSATVRVYSLVAPCRLPDLTSLALLGSVSGQPGLSRGPLPGYKTVSKWRLQLQDSTPFLLLSQRFCTTLHTSASLGCYLLFTHMPDCPLAPLGQV